MLKLYGDVPSRGMIIQWYMEELGVPYELVRVSLKGGEHLQPGFLAINPMGKLPAIVEGEFKLWESGAILLYLAEKYDRPPASPEAKAELTQWVFFANATLGPGIFIESSRERETPRLLQPLDDIFAQQSFLTGEDFTVADVAIGSSLAYIQMMLKIDYSPYPHIQSYLQRIGSRPAFQNTIAKRN